MFQPAELPRPLTPDLELEETVVGSMSDLVIDDGDVNVDVDVDVEVPERKPHFLDYDAVPPPEYEEEDEEEEEEHCSGLHNGERLKMDKKFERDGEVSDYELAASGYTKKEFTQDDNTLHLAQSGGGGKRNVVNSKPKHFLDENPIPPDYMLAQELREHRSLDRNFERQSEQQRTASPAASLRSGGGGGGSRNSRERSREPSYTLSRFLDGETATSSKGAVAAATVPSPLPPPHQLSSGGVGGIPKGAAWTECYSLVASTDADAVLGSKVECVYSLLSMLGSNDPLEMSKKFLEMSGNAQTCATLRRSGCMPLLVQMMHAADNEEPVRKCASLALHNVVHSHPDEKAGRREAKVLRLLDQIMDYCNFLKTLLQSGGEAIADDSDRHPLAAISSLMKVSFDEEHRHAMCELGALQAIPNLVHLDHAVHGPKPEDQCCNSLRRYALMALTNLTFGDENNKALLCGQKQFMEALVAQLDSAPDDLLQVTASVLRNLSWRADSSMKAVLNEIGTVTALALAAMKNKSENTLKAILSALWNLSAHCSTNKAEFCAVDGALAFLVRMLSYEGPSKTLKIIENAGGILRNVSSHIAVCEPYRQILREHNCLAILLQQLKSESLTVVSNSCGTLWNLSARCPEDQKFLWDNGAVPMLRSLIHSKHAMISEGSSSALKNLLNFRPAVQNHNQLDPIARSMGLKKLPTLDVRKQKALQQELGEKAHAETCDNLDNNTSNSTNITKKNGAANLEMINRKYSSLGPQQGQGQSQQQSGRLTRSAMLTKSESRDSVFSAKSDTAYEHMMRSHSASDAAPKLKPFVAKTSAAAAAAFENDDGEGTEDRPIDYSVKYNEAKSSAATTYQETDLDQPTDFSLRYAENQIESDIDVQAAVNGTTDAEKSGTTKATTTKNETGPILEDSVKCYQTEDTPYVISNAASITDLRQATKPETPTTTLESEQKPLEVTVDKKKNSQKLTQYGCGSFTPEKPINYCEEGTPGYFSRYDSLSSLDEPPPQPPGGEQNRNVASSTAPAVPSEEEAVGGSGGAAATNKEITKPNNGHQETQEANSALETPLMFSRRSSMDSLVNEDVGPIDDKSSVVSDFSRLASGIISPSELPDSPTQSMPQSPRRHSVATNQSPMASRSAAAATGQRPLRSVFEDDLSAFNVEHTPAQFSCATSLSNLSIIDDEQTVPDGNGSHGGNGGGAAATAVTPASGVAEPSENEDDEQNLHNNDDDLLLANCINMGMNRPVAERKPNSNNNNKTSPAPVEGDEPQHYCTEDTPALLSKVGSNTNLSAISINSKEDGEVSTKQTQRCSLNLSDDVSSNASECGAAAQSADLLQQCIRDGMQKTVAVGMDPIAMLRRGGNILPPYLPVGDEMSKYVVEDSPCNFSVVSGLSNLTVGSSLVGPAVQLQETIGATSNTDAPMALPEQQENVRRQTQWQDDSLSSISVDSEDDTNLLSQAIAAGCNRPKSNLGFSSSTSTHKRLTSLSSSQPMAINAATSASSLNSAMTARNYQRQQNKSNRNVANHQQQDSYSSVESSDSNDNQSKSLFELCILKGMYKSKEPGRKQSSTSSTQSNPNLKQFESLPVQLTAQSKPLSGSSRQHRHHHHRDRERERKDEKLLQECISTGISRRVGSSGTPTPINYQQQPLSQQQQPQQSLHAVPKNAKATSAAALELCHPMAATTLANVSSTAAPDVEMTTHIINHNQSNSSRHNNNNNSHGAITDVPRPSPLGHQSPVNGIGCNVYNANDDDRSSDESNQSFIMDTMVRLDGINECPSNACANDKHKDPDLMLKSVERLTLEFVTSAEQLRSVSQDVTTTKQQSNKSNTDTHNTWNENTCPNDVSFPSVSISAPVLASLSFEEDAAHERMPEITPTNGPTQPNSLETETDTLINDEQSCITESYNSANGSSGALSFQLGGQVQSAAIVGGRQQQSLLFNGTSASMMTTSTMIAYEARAVAENLQQMQLQAETSDDQTELTFSINSLDLDNVRPPSGMESLNASGCYHDSHSLTQPSSLHRYPPLGHLASKSPKFPRKPFPAGLVARRALGQLAGSAESVNSSCNLLDNVKPPSLMDELLDSMISVDSIQSEVADGEHDCSMATTISVSNYETAAGGQFDDNTVTLQSCCDYIPRDDEDEEEDATINDFSSAESTPKHNGSTPSPNRRTLTPKQKRRLARDRYKTYTITTAMRLLESEPDELLQVEIGSDKTQQGLKDDCPSEELSSIRAMMKQFTYITDININTVPEQQPQLQEEELLQADDFEQNSETESMHGNHEELEDVVEVEQQPQTTIITKQPTATTVKSVRGRKKPAYVSPYSMQSQRNNANTVVTRQRNLPPIKKKQAAVSATTAAPRIERQGTFVKDEPTITTAQVPIVESIVTTTTTTTSPTHRISKLPTKRTPAAKTSPSMPTTSPKRNTIVRTKAQSLVTAARKATGIVTAPQRANTNIRLASAKAAAASRVAIQASRISATTPPSRSNSNLNGNSATAAAAAAARINQAQSRIASIWKRVDEAKIKATTTNTSTTTPTTINAKVKPTSSNMKTPPTATTTKSSPISTTTINGGASVSKPVLLRSSTFDNTPTATTTTAASATVQVKSKLPVVGRK